MERLTFFCLSWTTYLSRSYQLIISSENYCLGERDFGRYIDAISTDQTFSTAIFWQMQPEQVAKSLCVVFFLFFSFFFPPAEGCFIAKYSFAAPLILRNNVTEKSVLDVNC